jgi:tape measure domain-containing protein
MTGRSLEFGIKITADGRVAIVESGNVRTAIKGVGDEARTAAGNTDKLQESIGRVVATGAALAGVGLGASLLRDTVRAADSMTNLESRIRLVTSSLLEQSAASDAVFAISQNTRQALDATGDLYFKIAKGGETLGLSQQRIIGLTETISKSVALSGASAESAKAAIMQFGQALASGTLRGDELNSVMEQTPALAEAIAKGMGKSVGELRAMGEQGAITVQQIVMALEKQAPEIARQFGEIAPTVSASWQTLENSVVRYIGDASKATGATAALSGAIGSVAENLHAYAAVLATTTAVGLGGLIGQKAQAVKASVDAALAIRAETAATVEGMRANVAAQAARVADLESTMANVAATRAAVVAKLNEANATAAASAAVGAHAYAMRIAAEATAARAVAVAELAALGRLQATTEAQITAATVAHTAAENALATAMVRKSAAATGARAVMGALGGPIGVVTTALMLGATAWMLWGDRAEDASQKAAKTLRDAQDAATRTGKDTLEVLKAWRDTVAVQYYDNPTHNNPARARLAELDALVQAEERAAARSVATTGQISDAWNKLHLNKAQQRAAEISDLDKAYAAESAKAKGNGEMQLRLAADYQSKLKVINDKYRDKKANDSVDDATVEANKAYAQSITELIGIEAKATGSVKDLTAAEQVRQKLITSGAWDKLAPETRKVIDAYIASANAALDSAEATKQWSAAANQAQQEATKKLETLEQQAIASEQEIRYYGMTEGAIQRDIVARLEERRTIEAGIDGHEATVAALDREIAARKRLAGSADAKDMLDANKRAAADLVQEYARGYENIERGLTDAIIQGGEDGLDSVEKMFSRSLKAIAAQQLVIRPIIQPIYATGASLMGVDMSKAGGSWATSGNLLQTGSNAYSLASGNVFQSAGGWAQQAGISLQNASFNVGGEPLYNFGQSLYDSAQTIQAASDVFAYAAALNSASDGKWGQAIGQAAGYYFGGPVGSFIGSTVGGFVDDLFGGGGGPKPTSRYVNRPGDDKTTGGPAAQTLETWTKSAVSTFDSIAALYGSAARATYQRAYLATDPEGDAKTQLDLWLQGADLSTIYRRRDQYNGQTENVGRSDAELQAAMADTLRDSILLGVAKADIGTPAVVALFDKFENKLGDLSATRGDALVAALTGNWLDELVTDAGMAGKSIEDISDAAVKLVSVSALKAPLDQLGFSFVALAPKLATVLGSVDAAASALGAYYGNDAYYSAAERRARTLATISAEFEKYGAVMPKTTAEWRRLTEQVAAMGESGAEAFAKLVGYSSAFADAVSTDTASVTQQADDARAALISRYQEEISVLENTRDKFAGFATSLKAFQNSLRLGDLSTLSPLAKYDEAKRQFDDVSRRARLGETSAIEQLQNVSQSYLEASRGYYASSPQYAADFQSVMDAVEGTETLAERQAGIAKEQLDTLTGLAVKFGLVEAHTASLEDLISKWVAANTAAGIATPGVTGASITTSGVTSVSSATDEQMGVFRQNYLSSLIGRAAADPSLAESAAAQAASAGFSADQIAATWNTKTGSSVSGADVTAWARDLGIKGFATGGEHTGGLRLVGERGWEVEATGPARYWNQEQLGQALRTSTSGDRETLGELRRLAERLDALISAVNAGQAVNVQQARELRQHLSAAMSLTARRAA